MFTPKEPRSHEARARCQVVGCNRLTTVEEPAQVIPAIRHEIKNFFHRTTTQTNSCILGNPWISGKKTVKSSLLCMILFMLRNSEKKRREQEELDAVIGRDRLRTIEDIAKPSVHRNHNIGYALLVKYCASGNNTPSHSQSKYLNTYLIGKMFSKKYYLK